MRKLGEDLAKKFQPGDIVVLQGELGAGKTALTQGIGAGLGITGITSPTFVISRMHEGKVRLNHIDAYRLLDASQGRFEFDDLDIETKGAITIIEWGSDVASRLDSDYLLIAIEFGEKEEDQIGRAHV